MAASFGVHFGCTSACIAVCRDGKTDVIANDSGDRVTPAVVAFTDHDQTVGLAAKQGLMRNQENTICQVKRLIGRTFDEIDGDSSPAQIVNKGGQPFYSVEYKEKTSVFSPMEIASMIYKKMMETAESHGGLADSHDAVISVPLDFDEPQRAAVRDAAEKAGFNILRIISEPSAAVLAYNIAQMDPNDACNVMVLRVGGQSTTATVLAVASGIYRVIASVSDQQLGGHLIDDILVEHFIGEFQRQWKVDCRQNKRSVSKLKMAVENCKHVLSNVNVAQCSVESLFEGIDLNAMLSRSRFDALCADFVQRCLEPFEDVLGKANLSRDDINKVIMCGGCCKIPLLQHQTQEYFPQADVLFTVVPDEVHAVGAAIEAAILSGNDATESKLFATDSAMPCLSSEILVELNSAEGSFVVFPNFTPVPVRRQKTFQLASKATSVCLHILQSVPEGETTSLAKVVLNDLPEGGCVNAVFHVRHDGSLHVTCQEATTGKTQDVLIESS